MVDDALAEAGMLFKVDDSEVPLTYYRGAPGMTGTAAWCGLKHMLKSKSGETLVVSAAAGALGSVVGVLPKDMGLRVVGIAGGPEKCKCALKNWDMTSLSTIAHIRSSTRWTRRLKAHARCYRAVLRERG